MSSRRIVVDDNDTTRITYSDGWARVTADDLFPNSGPVFLDGEHSVSRTHGSFKFSFLGSSIEVFGTNVLQLVNGTQNQYDPYWQCLVDGKVIQSSLDSTTLGHNFKLCYDYSLNDTYHDLEIQATSSSVPFSVDRIMYTPQNNITSADVLWVGSQDLDFSFKEDKGDWSTGNDNKFSNVPGATVSYKFTGSKLKWFGGILADYSHDPATCTYAADRESQSFRLKGLPPNTPAAANQSWTNQLFFETETLPVQAHTLQVTYNGDHATPLSLGYVYIHNATFDPIVGPPPPPNLPGIPPPSSSSSPPSDAGGGQNPAHRPPIGAIVGPVIGAFILISILLYFLIRKCRQKSTITEYWSNHFSQDRDTAAAEPSSYEPYPIIVTTTRTVTSDRRDSLSPLDKIGFEGGYGWSTLGPPTSWHQLRKSMRKSRSSIKSFVSR